MNGSVSFIGAGPGAEDLLTLRALRLLGEAQVVLHDSLGVSEAVLALCPHARLVAVGKRAGRTGTEQAFINRRLVAEAGHGLRVVRLKGGDPSVFGRLEEEIQALRDAGIDYQVVPGITAASAAAAAAGVPLTRRGVSRSLTLATPAIGRDETGDDRWLSACRPDGTVAVYMAGSQLAATAVALLSRGFAPATPAIIARSISLPEQALTRLTLQAIADGQVGRPDRHDGPCLLLVGEALADRRTVAMPATCFIAAQTA
ncbi:MAG: uroporphyrinogen-III C-methyltransferase [Burkholderiaceae bacterium]